MSLLFPAMLAGLAGLAVPVVIHLIAKRRLPILDFPSIRLLKRDDRTNTFAMKLIDPGQLLLRLLVLLLLVLAMSRIFSTGPGAQPAPHNLVIVMDCSAGMNMKLAANKGSATLFEAARAKASQMLGEIAHPSQCALLAATDEARTLAPLAPSPELAQAELKKLSVADGGGCGLIRALAEGCELVSGRKEVCSQVVVLTDFRANAFTYRNQDDLKRIERIRESMGGRLQVAFVDVTNGVALENIGLVKAYLRNRDVKAHDDAHIVATVLNSSDQQKTAKVALSIGETKSPLTKEIPLDPHEAAVVDMTGRVLAAGHTHATVRIGDDNFASDDQYAIPLNVNADRKVLIVDGGQSAGDSMADQQPFFVANAGSASAPTEPVEAHNDISGATILECALDPGSKLTGNYQSGTKVTVKGPEVAAAEMLDKYDLFVLYDVSSLPEKMLEDLSGFITEGRSVVLICSARCDALKFNRVLASATAKHAALSPAQIGNEAALPGPVSIQHAGNTHPLLQPFHDSVKGDVGVIQFTKIRDVQNLAAGASVMLAGSNGAPLAVEAQIGRGHAVLLSFGLELDRGNIARTRVFPALIRRLADYLTGRMNPPPQDIVPALRPAVLDVSEPALALCNELELVSAAPANSSGAPAAAPIRLTPSPEHTVLIPPLAAGRYMLAPAGEASGRGSRGRYVTAYIDPGESDVTRMDPKELSKLLGADVQVLSADSAAALNVPGGEVWTALIWALIAAFVCEAISSFAMNVYRERQRAKEGA